MTKGPDAFRTISEVAEELNVPQHVLRFWETRFSQIRPLKRSGGRRFYRPDDVALLRGIRHLLYGSGYTIRGVQRILKEQGIGHVQRISPPVADNDSADDNPNLSMGSRASEHDNVGQMPAEPEIFGETAGDLSSGDVGLATQNDEPTASNPDAPPSDASAYGMGTSPAGSANNPRATDVTLDEPEGREPPKIAGNDPYNPTSATGHEAGWSAAAHSDVSSDSREEEAKAWQSAAMHTIDRYAPGPLSMRADRTGASRSQSSNDQIIQPQYRLTTDTRGHLQAVLEEIRECRRLLNSALSRLQD